MKPLDLLQEHPEFFRALPQPEFIHLDKGKFIIIDGNGSSGTSEMSARVKALYPVAARIRQHYRELGHDFVVPSLESEWWSSSRKPINKIPKEERKWRLMIRMPDFVSQGAVEVAKKQVIVHDKITAAMYVRLESEHEHDVVQMLHIGPWSREGETIKEMRRFIKKKHYVIDGPHHEVYLSDPHTTDPSRLRTILRQGVVA